MSNEEVARIFLEIADMLDLLGEKFKPEAYRRAARSIQSLSEDLRRFADRGELGEIPGVGEAIEEKVREYLRTGRIPYYEKLRAQLPPGILDLMHLPGVGPKTTRRFWTELKIEGPAELEAAIQAGKLEGVYGFGERKIELLKQALAQVKATGPRMPILVAWRRARAIVRELSAHAPVRQIEVAGSLRRRRESVGDLDFIVTSDRPEEVFEAFSNLPGLTEVKLRGETKETIVIEPGLQVDLRVVEPASFGAALQYFTGSKDHNVRLRTIARDRGLKINEYGVFRGEERVGGATEEEVYATLQLPLVPPEIRENWGEIEAAAAGRVPSLVDASDLRGDLHLHLSADVDRAEIAQWREALLRRGDRWVGFVLPGDGAEAGTILDRVRAIFPTGDGGRPTAGPRPFFGIERELARGAAPDRLPEGLDFWIARAGPPDAAEPVGAPPTETAFPIPPWFASHLRLSTGPTATDRERVEEWLRWAHDAGVALEVTPHSAADGLDPVSVRRAVERENRLAIHARAARPEELDQREVALGLARRGWTPPGLVLNTAETPGRLTIAAAGPARRSAPARGARKRRAAG